MMYESCVEHVSDCTDMELGGLGPTACTSRNDAWQQQRGAAELREDEPRATPFSNGGPRCLPAVDPCKCTLCF